MPAGNYNFTIEQNAQFLRVLTYKDPTGALVNLTGYTAKMQIKTSSNPIPLLTLTTTPDAQGNVITLGGAAGTITITINVVTLAAFTFSEARYDLLLTNPSSVPTRLLKGDVSLSPGTTS